MMQQRGAKGRSRRAASPPRSGGSEASQFLAGLGVVGMHRADEARVKRACDVPDLDRIRRIGNRRADQRLLDRPELVLAVTRTDVPGRGGNDLVVLDLAVLDFDPVAQRTTDRLGSPPTATVALARLDVPGVVELELAQAAFGLPVQLDGLVHAADLAQVHAGATHLLEHVEDERIVVLPALAMLAPGDQLARERPGFEAAVVHVRDGRRPRVLAVVIDGILLHRLGRAVERMHVSRAFVIPGVVGVLAQELLVHYLVRVGLRVVHAALHDDRRIAPVDGRLLVLVLVRQVAPADVLAGAAAVGVQTDVLTHAPVETEV
mmetsp:Transcript_18206/g.43601  ORF Transcript_18206/g.43601 Transcript_18206/m.43601 type:complete len:319 (-) Transcript_18206:2331-3287(-)